MGEHGLPAIPRRSGDGRTVSDLPLLLELRLDFIAKAPDLKRLLANKPCALVATIRRPADGGRWAASEDARQMLLKQCIVSGGFDWVDLETDVADQIRRFKDVKRIVSYHNLAEFPANLEEVYARMAQQDADVFKIVVAAQSLVGAALSDTAAINNRAPMGQTFAALNGEKFNLITVGPVEELNPNLPRQTIPEADEAGHVRGMLQSGIFLSAKPGAPFDHLAVRALSAGCWALCPQIGVYSELMPEMLHSPCLYDYYPDTLAGRMQDVWHLDTPSGYEMQLQQALRAYEPIVAGLAMDARLQELVLSPQARH